MNKVQKAALICSILFCLNYALDKLLGFDIFTAFVVNNYWLDKIVAFLVGVVSFLCILIFNKDE